VTLSRIFRAAPVLLLSAAFAAGASAQGDLIPSGLVDPPLFVTNESGEAITLAWQTSRPGVRLSPPRQAEVAAGASDHRIDPGLFWIVDGAGESLQADNVVYLSLVDADGGYAQQLALGVEIFADLAEVKRSALAVTIGAHGAITAEPRLHD